MNNEKLIEFIENSFLKDLLISSITDISYNGQDIYYQDNLLGRRKAKIDVTSKEAYDFIRQVANLSGAQFSYSDPILDISVGRYRINAVHFALSRKNREKCITFSIRIGFDALRIQDDGTFVTRKCLDLIELYMKKRYSIVIGGLTSSGKTEFQKFLISKLEEATRIVIIDNVDELDSDYVNRNIDISTWLNLEKFKNINFDTLVRNALRNNPDYMIVSEARGEEMLAILNSAMTGHPTITTIHAKDIETMYHRMARMCMLKNQNLMFDETLEDVVDYFKILVYIKKETSSDGKIVRYVDSIATNMAKKEKVIYRYPNKYYALPPSIKHDLDLSDEEFDEMKSKWKENAE